MTDFRYRGLIPFKPGQSGNPAGRPKGARSKLAEEFLDALYLDFQKHGPAAIERVRQRDPISYVRIIASLVPKQLNVERNRFDDMSLEEIDEAILALRKLMDDLDPAA